jgi:hypothetical protein
VCQGLCRWKLLMHDVLPHCHSQLEAVLRGGQSSREGELCVQAVFTLLDMLRTWLTAQCGLAVSSGAAWACYPPSPVHVISSVASCQSSSVYQISAALKSVHECHQPTLAQVQRVQRLVSPGMPPPLPLLLPTQLSSTWLTCLIASRRSCLPAPLRIVVGIDT